MTLILRASLASHKDGIMEVCICRCRWALKTQKGAEVVREDSPDPARPSGEVQALQGPQRLPGLSQNGLLDRFESYLSSDDEEARSPSDSSFAGRPGIHWLL